MSDQTLILNHEQIRQKINRIAYEIHENNFDSQSLIIVGVANQGFILAERVADMLRKISTIEITLARIDLNKDNPLSDNIILSIDLNQLADKNVIIADDVLNSGKTLMYATTYLLRAPVKKLQTVCLVDRRHRKYPIRADFVGLTLSTTIQEHIEVEFTENKDTVYLC